MFYGIFNVCIPAYPRELCMLVALFFNTFVIALLLWVAIWIFCIDRDSFMPTLLFTMLKLIFMSGILPSLPSFWFCWDSQSTIRRSEPGLHNILLSIDVSLAIFIEDWWHSYILLGYCYLWFVIHDYTYLPGKAIVMEFPQPVQNSFCFSFYIALLSFCSF